MRVIEHIASAAANLTLSAVLAALVWFAMSVREAHAVYLLDLWPICADPEALAPAAKAHLVLDADKITRLGCRTALPSEVWLYTLRCGPGTPKGIRTALFWVGDIEWKPILPESICELQAWYPGQWIKLFYTYRENLQGAWR